MSKMTLNDELEVIDDTIAELESRRVEIINKMEGLMLQRIESEVAGRSNVVLFPSAKKIRVSTSKPGRHVW